MGTKYTSRYTSKIYIYIYYIYKYIYIYIYTYLYIWYIYIYLLSGENSPKISNNPPVVCTNKSVVQKNYDVNTSVLVKVKFNTRYGITRNFRRT